LVGGKRGQHAPLLYSGDWRRCRSQVFGSLTKTTFYMVHLDGAFVAESWRNKEQFPVPNIGMGNIFELLITEIILNLSFCVT
jgi:hypothetical protein